MEMHIRIRHAVAMVLMASGAVAWSQTVYRCANLYSDVPCPGALVIDARDTRTPAQKVQTDHATRQSGALADRMEQERRALERVPPQVRSTRQPLAAGPVPRTQGNKTASKAPQDRSRTKPPEEPFTATTPARKPPESGAETRPPHKATVAASP